MEAGAHAFADAVAKGFPARGGESGRARRKLGCHHPRGGFIGKVRGDDGGAIVVIAGIEDEADRVPGPFAGLDRAEFIEHQHLGFEHRAQHFEFGRLDGVVIRILDLFQKLAVVAEEAAAAPLPDQLFQDPDREMRLASADSTNDQQPRTVSWIKLLDEAAGGDVSQSDSGIRAREVGREAGQFTMLIPLWDARGGEQRVGAGEQLAVAAGHAALRGTGNGLPSRALAQRTNFGSSFHVDQNLFQNRAGHWAVGPRG